MRSLSWEELSQGKADRLPLDSREDCYTPNQETLRVGCPLPVLSSGL